MFGLHNWVRSQEVIWPGGRYGIAYPVGIYREVITWTGSSHSSLRLGGDCRSQHGRGSLGVD